ncbi:MAG: hypothetical protein J6A56_01420, partial [Clostridia bacterium]|nr:hypothetical protein [Clostridia bacterium]
INVKILSENGEIYEAELASQIKLVNLDLDCNAHIADLFTAAVVLDETTVVNLTKETHIARSNLDKFAGTLINTAISYRCNNKGEISTIILGQNESSTRPMELLETISDGENTYDAESGFFSKGSTPISENAKVFYISGEDTISYAGYVIAKDGRCSAGDVNSLQDEGNYEAVLLFSRDVNDKAEVVLLLNEETPVTDDTTDEAEAQYAYVLAAEPVAGSWSTDREFINVKILSENGEIYEAELASKMKLVNLDLDCNAHIGDLFGSAVVLDETTTVDFTEESHIASANLYDFADALVNTMISYRGNSEGQISTIIFGQDEDDTRPMEILASSTSAEYNKADLVFDGMRNARVNEDTVVFYITSYEDYISYGDSSSMADSDKCLVGTIETLVDGGRYDIIAIGRDENDEAEVVLLLNEEIGGKYDQSASIAVVDRVGATVVNGTDFVYTVTFYMDGELKTATTKVDMDGAGYDFEYAQQGDIVKLNLYKDTILAAEPVLTFDRQGYGFYAPAFGDGVSAMAPVFSLNSFLGEDEEFYFGAVTDFRVNGVAQVALLNENGIATGEIKSIKEAEDTCSYEYNPNKKAEECLSVGSLLDANADADLLDEGRYVYLKREPEQVFVETGLDNAIGMMDYVFVRYYN